MKKSLKILSSIVLGIFLIGIVNAAAGYCCEKTISGAWCQYESAQTSCDANFQKATAFCEATEYCRKGTCINQQEGTCMPATKSICDKDGGFWSDKPKSELPQCKNGCCLIGDSASFVTQVACNRMSSIYGLDVNFQAGINTELSCLASASPSVKGACVYTKEFVKTCSLTTKKVCQENAKSTTLSEVTFHEGYLCSAPELETVCSKSQNTKCGEDGRVYFVDTCGNLANVYDSTKIKVGTSSTTVEINNYWTKIQEPTCSTKENPGNKNSASCGDCDYNLRSMCQKKKIGDNVDSGEYLCRDLDCKDYKGAYSSPTPESAAQGNYPKHGESWCVTDEKNGGTALSPGASSFVLSCYNGEVNKPFECDETRQKVCKETTLTNGFKTAGCKGNVWQYCIAQNDSESCLNEEIRDCNWITGDSWNGYYYSTGYLKNDKNKNAPTGVCVPKYQSGFTEENPNNCGAASAMCYVKMTKGLLKKDEPANWKCDASKAENNCSCLDAYDNSDSYVWETSMNNVCIQLGDCGIKKNYIGELGYPTKTTQIIEGKVK